MWASPREYLVLSQRGREIRKCLRLFYVTSSETGLFTWTRGLFLIVLKDGESVVKGPVCGKGPFLLNHPMTADGRWKHKNVFLLGRRGEKEG